MNEGPFVVLLADLVDEANAAGAEAEDGIERPRSVQRAINKLADRIDASIEAAREEGRAEERAKLHATEHARGYAAGEAAGREREAAANALTDKALAQRDEARRERDEAKKALALTEERICPTCFQERTEAEAERDAALAKLAEVEAAASTFLRTASEAYEERWPSEPEPPHESTEGKFLRAETRLAAALTLTPSTALAERDARVRAEALGEAADEVDRGTGRGGWQDGAPFTGDVLPHEIADWLRARAKRGG